MRFLKIIEAAPTAVCSGTISLVDVPNRALQVQLPAGERVEVSAVPDCRIGMHGEAVRFRLMLAGDEVDIHFLTDDAEMIKAVCINVRNRHCK